MRVKPYNKKLLQQYACIVSTICGIISFVVIFFEIPDDYKVWASLAMLSLLVIIYLICLIQANCQKKVTLNINRTKVVVKFGNLFEEEGLKTIAFNEFFDTIVDDKIISSDSLNGIFLNEKINSIGELDAEIENNHECNNAIVKRNYNRPRGKTTRYKLGTSIRYGDYILVAFSRFDRHNRAFLTLPNYYSCLITYWSEVNRIYAGRNIALPLLGTGITRLGRNSISEQESLDVLLNTLKHSNLSFKHSMKITIVISKSLFKDINLYDLKGE